MDSNAILGIDLGGTNIRLGKVCDGRVVHHLARRISSKAAEEVILDEMYRAIEEVLDTEVVAIGCGVPSVVDLETGVVYAVENLPSWKATPLKQKLEERYGLPVLVNNDANLFALGELYFGKGRGARNMVGMTLGTGLGVGVIIDGHLYCGANCGTGEIGSIPYRDGALETYCSGEFFERVAGESGDAIFERAQQGDEKALELFDEFGYELGQAVMTALYAYDPDLIVFGGSVSAGYSLFEAGLRRRLQDFDFQHSLETTSITCSEIEHVAILGAAALHLEVGELGRLASS
jgi:glucokinase